jgi:diguanylate cyclase (GGDEF)-like protein
MTHRLLRTNLVIADVAVVGFLAVPDGGLLQTGWQIAFGWYAAATMIVSVVRRRPALAAAWWLFALGVAGNVTGILVETILARTGHEAFPSWADAAYLSLYPAVAVGLVLLIRRRTAHRDWSSVVDATTLTTGMSLLAWIFMVRPAASDPSIGLLGHIVSVAYPVGDIVLLAMTVRLMISGSARNVAFRLVCAALMAFLAGDGAWAVVNQMGWSPGPTAHKLLAEAFLAGYLLFGAAAAHPGMRSLTRAVEPRSGRISRPLLLALTAASLVGPGLLIVQAARHRVTDVLSIALGCVALFLLVVTRMAQLIKQLDVQTEKVRELAVTDELTGLPNRRAWNTELPRTIERVRRTGDPLVVAILDIDHFKHFNDAYGHPAGDRLLKEAAAAWQDQLRTADHLARYGGEEFVVLLPGATAAQAREIVDRMRLATPLGQTFSAGIAVWNGGETSDALTDRADKALYEAKNSGRNRIVEAAPADGLALQRLT